MQQHAAPKRFLSVFAVSPQEPQQQALVVIPHVVEPPEGHVQPHVVALHNAVVGHVLQPSQAEDHAVIHAVVAQQIVHPKEGLHNLLALKQKVFGEAPP
ncbi:Uncharacterised protein [Yersinia enterocolitica]|nr:Uncharacterised protein [Yersinia enterocolitica]